MSEDTRGERARIVELSESNFQESVDGEGIVLVDCWAAWCGACKDFQPVFEDAARRHPRHTFAKLNTQQEAQIVARLGIEQIPSLVLFRDGLMLFNQAGYFDGSGLDHIVDQAESLDMNEVRTAMAAELEAGNDPRGSEKTSAASTGE